MPQMLAHILSIKVFETSEALGMEENQYRDNFGIGESTGLISVDFTITKLVFYKFG